MNACHIQVISVEPEASMRFYFTRSDSDTQLALVQKQSKQVRETDPVILQNIFALDHFHLKICGYAGRRASLYQGLFPCDIKFLGNSLET